MRPHLCSDLTGAPLITFIAILGMEVEAAEAGSDGGAGKHGSEEWARLVALLKAVVVRHNKKKKNTSVLLLLLSQYS